MPTSLYSSGESGDSAAEKKHPKKRKKASSFAVDIIQEHLQQTQQPTRSRVVEVHSINRRRPSCSFQVDNDGTISPAATIAPTPRSSLQRAHQRSRFFPSCATCLALVFAILAIIFALISVLLFIRIKRLNSSSSATTNKHSKVAPIADVYQICDNKTVSEERSSTDKSTDDNDDQSPSAATNLLESKQLKWPPPSGSFAAQYKRAAIVSDHGRCSEIGRDIMLAGGNAIDAAISTLFCIGTVNPQSSGLGGGFMMTIYNASTQRCMSIDARESAPIDATPDMFSKTPNESFIGYRAIATPGELHGFWTAFNRFGSGKVVWKHLLEPSIQLARDGFPVSANLATVLQQKEDEIVENDDLKRIFVDSRTGRVYEEGDILKRERLAELLDELANAEDPVQLFYKEGIAQTISAEIKEHGGHLTVDDLANYQALVHETPLESEMPPPANELIMCGPAPPSSFVLTQAIINIVAELYKSKTTVNLDDVEVYHRFIEAQKFIFAERTKLGDTSFVKSARIVSRNMTKHSFIRWIASLIPEKAKPISYYSLNINEQPEDHGTSQVSTIDHDGNAVSVTSTINQLFGAKEMSPTLGIIWNNQMDDFNLPSPVGHGEPVGNVEPSPENQIAPKKRPMSSMSPMIVYNKNNGKVQMVVGASGGSRIISSVAQTVIRALVLNQTLKEAVDAPRFHNQFLPHTTEYERSIPGEIINQLINVKGQRNMTAINKQPSVVQALLVLDDGFIHGNCDWRRRTATYPTGF